MEAVQLALLISVFLVAVSYMAGSAMSMPSLKGFARAELTELGVSAVIIIIAILLATPGGVFDQVAAGFAVQTAGAPSVCEEWLQLYGPYTGGNTFAEGNLAFGQADYFLGCRPGFWDVLNPAYGWSDSSGIMLPKLTGAYLQLESNELVYTLLGNFQVGIHIPIYSNKATLDIGFIPLIFLNMIVEMLTILVDTIGTLTGAFVAQKMLLNFIEETMLAYIL